MATKTVSSGQISSGLTVGNGDRLVVYSGGKVTHVIVNEGGAEVLSGGTAQFTTISGTALHSARELISAGGDSISAVVSFAGKEVVLSGGRAVHAAVSGGGRQIVSSGGTVTGTAIGSGGTQIIYAGGSAVGAVVGNHGREVVPAGGAAIRTSVGSGGIEAIYSGGFAQSTMVSSGGEVALDFGGHASGVTVLAGGEVLFAGGSVDALRLQSGGSAALIAEADGLVVSNGASVIILSGGLANGMKVLKGGTLVYAGGSTVGAVISSGGNVGVAQGTKVTSLTVENGVTLFVSAGGTASDTTLNGGTEFVEDGGAIAGVQHFGGHAALSIAAKQSVSFSVSGFSSTDIIDFSGYSVSKSRMSFKEDSSNTFGILTLKNGTLTATITLFGQYTAAGFSLSPDVFGGGTEILCSLKTSAHPVIAAGHS